MIANKLWVLLAGVVIAGCGYGFQGAGSLPGDAQTVFVQLLTNRTSETGMENVFTGALIEELTRNQQAAGEDRADARLSGEIVSISTDTIARTGATTSVERRVRTTLNLELTDRAGEVIWKARNISASEAFPVDSDSQAITDQNQREALTRLAQRVAESVYSRMTDDF
ncbi:MAG: LptE family protein [Desulfobacteraceae bacterium]|jgi:outer membrane lipopolysaccharide assembly protein LptE/RlpB